MNWFPWGAEAFETDTKEGKPIFLSIGYSTCHWCHVMAHESFSDAGLRNPFFLQQVTLIRPEASNPASDIADLAPFTRSMVTRNGQATAYVCQNFACRLPAASVGQMLQNLSQNIGG